MIDRFRAVLKLPDDVLRKINEWSRKNTHVFLEAEPPEEAHANALGVSRDDFFSALSLIGAYVFSAEGQPPDLAGFADSLKRRGLDGSIDAKLALLIEGVNLNQRQIELTKQRVIGLQSVVPTLESTEVVCDLRGIFQRYPSPGRSETHVKGSRTLLGLEPVALVSLVLSDTTGKHEVSTFQASDAKLKHLIQTLHESVQQLEILKGKAVLIGSSEG